MIDVKKIAIPFGRDGNKNTIYDTRQTGQAENDATWSGGFPPVTMQDKTDGGMPPKGLDFNGIFHDISSNTVFLCMGGQYRFDKEYADKVGGYPKGAILINDALDKQYVSNTDKNKINFNTANPEKLTAWSIISIKDIDKLLADKINNADFSTALNLKADAGTQVIAGNGLTGGGTLQSNRTLTLGTPSKIEETSKNSVTANSHTHEIARASTTTAGITKLTSSLSDDTDKAATPKMVNDVNRAATTAQKTANNADGKAVKAQNTADDAMRGLEKKIQLNQYGVLIYRSNAGTGLLSRITNTTGHSLEERVLSSGLLNTILEKADGTTSETRLIFKEGVHDFLVKDVNTTTSSKGFLREKGSKEAVTTDELATVMSKSKTQAVTPFLLDTELTKRAQQDTRKRVDVTQDRVKDVVYTNTTDMPIDIDINVELIGMNFEAKFEFSVNGKKEKLNYLMSGSPMNYTTAQKYTKTILPGEKYKFETAGEVKILMFEEFRK